MHRDDFVNAITMAKNRLNKNRGEFGNYEVKQSLIASFGKDEFDEIFSEYFIPLGFLSEFQWLYQNCEEVRQMKEPWSDENTKLIQAWRHAWLNHIIAHITSN